jgi:two-component sensor histidine kinase
LSGAHALARREFGRSDLASRSSDLGDLIRTIVRPYEKSALGSSARFLVDGPLTPCADHATNGVALVVHELATNAAKYGALCTDDGQIDISWQEVDDNVLLCWAERGGPLVDRRPATSGFGSSLVQTMIVNQLGGSVDYCWQADGLVVKISIPAARLSV